MSKIYLEMNDKEKQLHHIADSLDYAIATMAEGLDGTGTFEGLKPWKVLELEDDIVSLLNTALEDVQTLLSHVK